MRVPDVLQRPMQTKRRLAELDIRIAVREERMLPSGISYDGTRVQGTKGDRMSIFAGDIEALLNERNALEHLYKAQLEDAERAISSLPYSNERQVLQRRYLKGEAYEKIAEEMNYSIDRIYQLRRKALKRLQ